MLYNILEKFLKLADCMIPKYQVDNCMLEMFLSLILAEHCMPEKSLAGCILEMFHSFAGVERHYLFVDYK